MRSPWKSAAPLALLFVLLVVAANWLTSTYGMVGGLVTAGTFAAGLTFAVRDGLPRWWTVAAVAVGAGLSVWLASPALALASGVAFAVSELADYAVYAPMRRRSLGWAMLLSNTVGAVLDSLLFLWLAGFPIGGWSTQTLVKVAVTLPVVLGILALRRGTRRPVVA
jgi:uncharacterized PurR-regulated membrane protein YhhQ (DUF165 family)